MRIVVILLFVSISPLLILCQEMSNDTSNSPPVILLQSILDQELGGYISIPLEISDKEGDLSSFLVEYSKDEVLYGIATAGESSDSNINIETGQDGVELNYIWDSLNDVGEHYRGTVFLRFTPYDSYSKGEPVGLVLTINNDFIDGIIETPRGIGSFYTSNLGIVLLSVSINDGRLEAGETWLNKHIEYFGGEGENGYRLFLDETPPSSHFEEISGIPSALYLPILYIDMDGDLSFSSGDIKVGTSYSYYLLYLNESPQDGDLSGTEAGFNLLKIPVSYFYNKIFKVEILDFHSSLDIWTYNLSTIGYPLFGVVYIDENDTFLEDIRVGLVSLHSFEDNQSLETVSEEIYFSQEGKVPFILDLPDSPPSNHPQDDLPPSPLKITFEIPIIYNDIDGDLSYNYRRDGEPIGLAYDETSNLLTIVGWFDDNVEDYRDILFLTRYRINRGWCLLNLNTETGELSGFDGVELSLYSGVVPDEIL